MPQQRGTSGELVGLFAFDLYAVLAEIDLQALRLFLFLVLLVAKYGNADDQRAKQQEHNVSAHV